MKKIPYRDWSGGSGRMVRESRFLCHSLLRDRELEKFAHRNVQFDGNFVDHRGGDIVFSAFNPPDLLPGISHLMPQFLLGHLSGQSQLAHPDSQGVQKILVYHFLHIQVWQFKNTLKSPCMGYFYVFDYFWPEKKRLKLCG